MILDPSFPIAAIVIGALVLVGLAIAALALGRVPWWSWSLRILAVLLLVVIALRPQLPAPTEGPTAKGSLEVYFAADTTSSSAAEDWNGTQTRLTGMKSDMDAIVAALPGAQFSLVTFDSSAVQRVPLTADATALDTAVSVLTQEVTQYSQGSSVDEAVPLLTTLLSAAQKARPGDRRVLFYLGDGEQTASQKPGSFAKLAPYLNGGGVLGYGTAAGGRMLSFDGYGDATSKPTYIQDTTQNPPVDALSKIDESELASIAKDLGVAYTHRTQPTSVATLVQGMDPGRLQVTAGSLTGPTEFYWWFAIPLGVLLLIEFASALARIVRLSRTQGVER